MKRMLINATQPEERRLAIVDGQKLLDYEIEIEGREQRKGNIYKAVVTRVEPSLEACFVDYGEDRHGFLPFKEISKQFFTPGIAVSQAKISDVIREGQELLVQVEKEERGNKGAALTTFVSLAGRYVVLMPNNPRGGGVSRRIEGEERAELKDAMDKLEYPGGMSIIARTAGIGRTAPELQWDLNYLLKLWTAIDGAAQNGQGAFLIYQESSLVIRAIRDYFSTDIGDILIDTDDIFEQAQQFMANVMPEHASRVKRYRDDAALFSRFQIEHQIESAYARTVQLPGGGAIVIDHTEALVSVDVNSARSIKGVDIEETATRTNLEAADEVARQMRLRDLGGLIVIDFIDMEESRNRRDVENRLREALRQDRARVQFGSISKFGLLEMSRQRLKPALAEGASISCPRCGGSGHIRDTESSALQILRLIQEESMKDATAAVHVQVPVDVASFLLNEKRPEIAKIEIKQRVTVLMIPNKTLETPNYRLDRLKLDDPRLEQLAASYTLVEEIGDPTAVTRRSQEPTNKQTPIIKGVLPDAPAPLAAPRPESPTKTVEATPSTGLWGWLKQLFGMSEAAAPAPEATPAKDTKNQGQRRDDRRDGRRDGRHSGRRNDHPETRTTTASSDTSDRNARDERRGDRHHESRSTRTERPESDQRDRNERTDKNRNRVERSDNTERNGAAAPQREARNERGSRSTRQPHAESQQNDHRQTALSNGTVEPINGVLAATDTSASSSAMRTEKPARQTERKERKERPTHHSGESEQIGDLKNQGATTAPLFSVSDAPQNTEAATYANETSENTPTGVRKERRSRDRYGRDRRERNHHKSERTEFGTETSPIQAEMLENTQEAPRQGGIFDAFRAPAEPATVNSAAPAQAQATTVGSAAISASKPVAPATEPSPPTKAAAPFNLPVAELQNMAQQSGLQWVGTDAAKVAAAQQAIAAEPKPERIPRERPASVAPQTAPLTLVETKRDLGSLDLPFEADKT